MEHKLSTFAFWISIVAVLISFGTLYLEHLKNFSLRLEEGSSVTLRGDKKKYFVAIPILFVNDGARGGVIKSFDIYIEHDNKKIQSNAGIVYEHPNLVDISKATGRFSTFYLKGKDSVYKILGAQIESLLAGEYTCKLEALLSPNKYVEKSFEFKLDDEQVKFLQSGGSVNILINKIVNLETKKRERKKT